MSLRAPFLVKQYLSDDVESGSYSKIFWYHPLQAGDAKQGGLGLFFEVLSGDVDDDVYEQITKRFWNSFTDNFYSEGFEESLKKSIKMFIHLLRSYEIEEGLDVNIVLFNVVESKEFYTLKLISFGDADIFVVRDGKFADMANMVPKNASLYDLKFLEVELDKGDVLMLGNKTLLRNAFEADLFSMESVGSLLNSLEEFKDNLFGSKKLLLVAAHDGDLSISNESKNESSSKTKVISDIVEKAKESFLLLKGTVMKYIPKKKEEKSIHGLDENSSIVFEGLGLDETTGKDKKVEKEIVDVPEIKSSTESISNEPDEEVLMGEDLLDADDEPQKEEDSEVKKISSWDDVDAEINGSDIEKVKIKETSAEEFEQKPDEEAHIIDSPKKMPGRSVSVDDFVIEDEVDVEKAVAKDDYKEIVDDAIIAENNINLEHKEKSQESGQQFSAQNSRSVDYVHEFRAQRSPVAKLLRSPAYKNFMATSRDLLLILWGKILGLLGKDVEEKSTKARMKPSRIEPRKIQPGFIIIGVLVIVVVIIRVRGNIVQNKLEQQLVTDMKEVVGTFNGFYEDEIAPIDTEDLNHQLELCATKADPVYKKESEVLPQFKNEEPKNEIQTMGDQVRTKVAECEAKYDRIHGIVRVKDGELIADFKTSLGSDSNISAMDIYKGYLVVTDSGRNAVYQMNVETRRISKFEDPLSLVSEPITLGTGEGILFVCDSVNGVMYYSSNAIDGKEGFVRITGAEPSAIGECSAIDGYAKNAYVVPTTGNVVYKLASNGDGTYAAPQRYISDLSGARSLSIDGNIYVTTAVGDVGQLQRFYAGNPDTSFRMPQTTSFGALYTSYTNPSNDRNIYVFDKTANAIYSIEKPAQNRHSGLGVIEKTYLLLNNDKFSDVKAIAVNLNGNNEEVYMYILSGSTIWRVQL